MATLTRRRRAMEPGSLAGVSLLDVLASTVGVLLLILLIAVVSSSQAASAQSREEAAQSQQEAQQLRATVGELSGENSVLQARVR